MSLQERYQTLSLYRSSESTDWSVLTSETLIKTFKGLIQPVMSKYSFVAGKDSNSDGYLLFANLDVGFQSGDLVANTDGKKYIVAKDYQPSGITGIKSHHVEIRLELYNG